MSNSASSTREERSAADRRPGASSTQGPVRISVPVPPDALLRTKNIGLALLPVAGIPVLVGIAVVGVEGTASAARLRQAWPLMALLAVAHAAATLLHAELDQFPFVSRGEALLFSASLSFPPAGALFASMGAPVASIGLLATGGSLGWYFAVQGVDPARDTRLLVLPGGALPQLLTLPEVSVEAPLEDDRSGEGPRDDLDGLVADPRALPPDGQSHLSENGTPRLPLYAAGDLYQRLAVRIPLDLAAELSLGRRPGPYPPYARRALDLLLVVTSLPVTVPLLAATALAIRVGSQGPVLFWQERVGQGGEPFHMAKFRSMHVGHEGETSAVFADEDDDRVTPVGQFIRRSRLDELPQLWNVLKGDMSLVGPRPEQVRLADHFADALPLYSARHRVPPGITGWAQVLQGYAATVDETRQKLEYDLYYVKHQSVFLDLLILYLTVKTLLTGFGAR